MIKLSRLTPLAILLNSVVFPVWAQTASAEGALPEVKVTGTADKGYTVNRSRTAMKTDMLLRDTPQAVTVISKELIRDQSMQSLSDVIRYVPGIVAAQGEGNRDTAVFRGNSSTGDFYVDGIRDDVQYYRDFYNIESVEALKGSNAMIFGRGGSGGVINRVTKQPDWRTIRDASITLGSWNQRRVTIDAGQALSESAAARVAAVSEDSDSYRNGFHLKRSGINPTLTLRAGNDTSVVIGYEYFKDQRTADRGIPSFQGRPLNTDASAFFGNPEINTTWAKVNALTTLIEHDFGQGVNLTNRTRYAEYDKFYQNIVPGAVNAAGTMVALSGYNNATQRNNFFNQTDVSWGLNTGSVRHKLLGGVELGRQETDNFRNTAYFQTGGGLLTSINAALANPVASTPVIFRQSATDANNHGTVTTKAIYLQDQIELSSQWQFIAGLRRDSFDVDFTNNRTGDRIRTTDTPVSPRAGLVFKPLTEVSLYLSYSKAFVPRAGDQLSSLTLTNQVLDPEEFKNLELGAKWDINPGLSATAALYQLDRSNIAVSDPSDPSKSILVDGQRSRGLELGLSGKLSRDWSMMAGYAYQDAKITKTQSATALAGATLAQVPRHSASLWNRYDFSPVVGAGLGIVYRSALYASTDNTVTISGFTRLDAALFYTISKNLKMQLNIENLLDKKYYAFANSNNNITPGSPRALRVSLNASF
ncbi:TonB-dependent receptor [Undibacterium oligocarboniphilum]|uniref:TonB-dependent siderophore receptor n=1 Tax=Undibacterium oligocarboniphilum TaxID=666702 RepID=A0A850QKZ4_9BURK|nr:TonB-dependent siderophore receptor [Undibacterium oligocarboniphilum]MBC3868846.1 TonB-dependent siderophore receptor [Undibacterium oligocarboniphilum]NVO76826.1 TonB-dependent siderophore receptor [Undibacterium oligocarboniphilum]